MGKWLSVCGGCGLMGGVTGNQDAGATVDARWRVDGKFLRCGDRRVWCAAVTYGPFPGGWPADLTMDFKRIAAAGFNAVRIYEMPDAEFLDAAARCRLKVIAGLPWQATADFRARPALLARAHVALAMALAAAHGHPALAAVLVGNEIPGDLARWMGPAWVREQLEALIDTGRAADPGCLFGYANYPTTEYLELENADFTAMNVYLEHIGDFQAYLRRLHHIAGDRPVLITEFGLDSRRNGTDAQARLLADALRSARAGEAAGFAVYAWSDRWWNGREVTDWDFGLIDRSGTAKPALDHCTRALAEMAAHQAHGDPETAKSWPFSVIVCTRNGRSRIGKCLDACFRMQAANTEIIVVDDGSTDGTADFVAARFPKVNLLRLEPGGLSAARNAGAAIATGRVLAFTDDDCEPDMEWVARLRLAFAANDGRFAAMGGPNLPPPPTNLAQAVVASAPGAPSHVMLDDTEAEHLPGCNLAVTREAFDAIGGFDAQFHTAGDDVDFCWRLRDAGFRIGFAAGAFVWHLRRPTVGAFLRQQAGYGRAEALLMKKHPLRFTKRGDAKWDGFVYGGGPVRVIGQAAIYHGVMGTAGYQLLVGRMLPLRGLAAPFRTWRACFLLWLVFRLQPVCRAWMRNRRWAWQTARVTAAPDMPAPDAEITLPPRDGIGHEVYQQMLIASGWRPAGDEVPWDLERDGVRVLFATERGDGEVKQVLARIWGATRLALD
jgi:GT2 family glycosyltransferase